jgi:hypothetical protein
MTTTATIISHCFLGVVDAIGNSKLSKVLNLTHAQAATKRAQ